MYSEPNNCGTRLSVYSESHYCQHNQEHLVTLEESIFRPFSEHLILCGVAPTWKKIDHKTSGLLESAAFYDLDRLV